jgi:hypothetical protein
VVGVVEQQAREEQEKEAESDGSREQVPGEVRSTVGGTVRDGVVAVVDEAVVGGFGSTGRRAGVGAPGQSAPPHRFTHRFRRRPGGTAGARVLVCHVVASLGGVGARTGDRVRCRDARA